MECNSTSPRGGRTCFDVEESSYIIGRSYIPIDVGVNCASNTQRRFLWRILSILGILLVRIIRYYLYSFMHCTSHQIDVAIAPSLRRSLFPNPLDVPGITALVGHSEWGGPTLT